MEVHPPEHGIHSWRDFLVHMGTITLGLLIALSLEGLLEYQHHRHLVHTAHTNLHDEVNANLETLRKDQGYLEAVARDLETDLHTLRSLPGIHTGTTQNHLLASWTWDGLNASAYNTARETGALSLMSYDEVQQIDALFTQQRLVDGAAYTYIRDVTSIRAPLQGGRTLADASPAEIQRMVDACSAALLDIELLRAFMRGLEDNYNRFDKD